MGKDETSNAWHLDKRIPLAFLLAIMIQTAGGAWFVSSLNEKVGRNTEINMEQNLDIKALDKAVSLQAVSDAQILERVDNLTKELEKTNEYLRRLSIKE